MKRYYAPQEFYEDSQKLIALIDKDFDAILAVARGGLSVAHMLSCGLDIRKVFVVSLASYDKSTQRAKVSMDILPDLKGVKRLLIAEDIVDSGKSM